MDPCSLTVQVALFLGVMGIIVMKELQASLEASVKF